MKLIILDRDGVINEDSDEYIKSVEEWQPIPGSIDAIARLCKHGYRVVVATNQSGIARGYYSVETLMAMHDKMHALVNEAGGSIEAVFFCPHGPDDNCECRKPKPGMYLEIGQRLRADLVDVPVIGDSQRDLDAAVTVGARPILVRTGKGERTLAALGDSARCMEIHKDLASAVDALLMEDE